MQSRYVVEKEMCSGCLACKEICPVNAIEIEIDKEGFKYPKINQQKCINCGKCSKLCASKRKETKTIKEPINIVGAKIKDEQERITSRSGGMFISMANYILSENGVIYGCQLGEKLKVFHSRATNKIEVDKFKGSKYVKSNLKNVYSQVKEDLKNDKKVLFSGTPCEVAGLYTALEKQDTKNLYTCDVICHGTPSPLIYQEFIDFMEKEQESKIMNIDFRDKNFGWSTHKETITFENIKISTSYYTKLFYSHHVLRPSCYQCKFSNMNRVSDVTIGDFWGIEKENAEFNDEKGVSLVIINTKKGEDIWNKIKNDNDWIDVKTKSYMQNNLKQATSRPKNREKFWKDYEKKGFEYIMKKYAGYEEEVKKKYHEYNENEEMHIEYENKKIEKLSEYCDDELELVE